MPVHNFVRLWCILLRNAAVQHPGKFARSCVGNTAAILHQHNMTGGDFLFQLDFDLFDGLIQTYVFVFLTSLFMKETME